MISFRNDEPAEIDLLKREDYVQALAEMVRTCNTPMVIGLYGRWGYGKTSIMKLVENELEKDSGIKKIWFDPWRCQFDEHPALGLLHAMFDQLDLEGEQRKSAKKILETIGLALGDMAIRSVTPLTIGGIKKYFEQYESKNFEVRNARAQLEKKFKDIIAEARKDLGASGRLVFFIDDLDRCLPESMVKVLEALKLYLNVEGCVYLLGADKKTVQAAIKYRFEGMAGDNEADSIDYLDKIVQLPFDIPPMREDVVESYIDELLKEHAFASSDCARLMKQGLDGNPRTITRFINTLTLNHLIAEKKIAKEHYQVKILIFLLMLKMQLPDLHDDIVDDSGNFFNLRTEPEAMKDLLATRFGRKTLKDVLELLPKDEITPEILEAHIFFARAMEAPDEKSELYKAERVSKDLPANVSDIVHRELAEGESIVSELLIFKTRTQQTWLVFSNQRIFCLLMNIDPVSIDGMPAKPEMKQMRRAVVKLQWKEPVDLNIKIKAYTVEGSHRVDIGSHKRWLYSKKLFPSGAILESAILSKIHQNG